MTSDQVVDTSAAISSHYDKRGEWLLEGRNRDYGSASIPVAFRAPYAYAESLIAAAAQANPGGRFLDLCCGTGVHAIGPAKLGFKVIGVDLSAKSIEAAKWLAEANGVSNVIRFEVADVVKWLPTQEPFDLIFISGSFYYLKQLIPVERILEQLRPGGRFICIETNGSNPLMALVRRLRAMIRRDRDDATVRLLLKLDDVEDLRLKVQHGQATFFDLLTLFGALLARLSPGLGRVWCRLVSGADRTILRLPALRALAFKFVVTGVRSN